MKKVQRFQKKYHNLGNLLRPLESMPVSRERVVPTEWEVRTILGDCMSKARVITTQEPQYQKHALICDFLDLANLSVQDEAALATTWIDDRPEGLKASERCVRHHGRTSDEQFTENLTADVQHAINKCESLGPSGKPVQDQLA